MGWTEIQQQEEFSKSEGNQGHMLRVMGGGVGKA